jgi:F-type H+-transporting ATPase subunit epsilon
MAQLLVTEIDLEVVTPEACLFSGVVGQVFVPGVDGVIGILPGHAPLLSELGIGIIEYTSSNKHTRFYCSKGFVEVLGARVSVLAEVAARSDEIDVAVAESDRQEAEAQLRSGNPDTDYQAVSVRLRQALAKLEAVQV